MTIATLILPCVVDEARSNKIITEMHDVLVRNGIQVAAIQLSMPNPLAVVLHCPACHAQHIDAPEECPANGSQGCSIKPCGPHGELQCEFCGNPAPWTNPPHKSHLCAYCGTKWRAANAPTNGVTTATSRGKADTWPP